jgi:2-polyprenyl-6-hydroxyphenyl methylase/3-demethylubiquinone-9 3-methyltransferase
MGSDIGEHAKEISSGKRFSFGKNWQRFLTLLNEDRISEAERSLREYLGKENLENLRFLDIGSGSGLFSLAARRLGATVISFDYDTNSVDCTEELKRRYFPGDSKWTVLQGSVLDENFVKSLGKYDIVYSWGVLHHTGHMWRALENAAEAAANGGLLYIAIYNKQIPWSLAWTAIKRLYNKLPRFLRIPYAVSIISPLEVRALLFSILRLRPGSYFKRWTEYQSRSRGMNRWYDIIDWIGGYPFETAKPEEIFEFHQKLGFELRKLFTCGGGHGCNQFVFEKRGGRNDK